MRAGNIPDADKVRKLAQLGCTTEQIADCLDCRRRTLERRFGRLIVQSRAEGIVELRRAQWEKVTEGNVPMMIWLGKQWLGQAERIAEPREDAPEGYRVELDFGEQP